MSIEPLDKNKHAALRIRPVSDMSFLAKVQYLPLLVSEFMPAGNEMPIVFLKNAETGRFQPVAMFGLTRGSNAFVEGDRWTALYLPAVVRQAPFRLIANDGEADKLYIGIDTAHESISDSDGERLFDEHGKESEFLDKRKQALFEYAEHMQLTQGFLEILTSLDLLSERTLSYGPEGSSAGIRGLYVINEQKLNELPVDDFIRLRDQGFLRLAYAHLLSLNQVRRLAATAATPAASPAETPAGA